MSLFVAIRNGLILSLAVVGMSACSSDNDDLDQYCLLYTSDAADEHRDV